SSSRTRPDPPTQNCSPYSRSVEAQWTPLRRASGATGKGSPTIPSATACSARASREQTPCTGMSRTWPSTSPVTIPTRRPVKGPGPTPTTMEGRSATVAAARVMASSTAGAGSSPWRRESGGGTPARTLPSSRRAAPMDPVAVSSASSTVPGYVPGAGSRESATPPEEAATCVPTSDLWATDGSQVELHDVSRGDPSIAHQHPAEGAHHQRVVLIAKVQADAVEGSPRRLTPAGRSGKVIESVADLQDAALEREVHHVATVVVGHGLCGDDLGQPAQLGGARQDRGTGVRDPALI